MSAVRGIVTIACSRTETAGGRLHGDLEGALTVLSFRGSRDRQEDLSFALWCGAGLNRPSILVAGVLDGMGGMADGVLAAELAASAFLTSILDDGRPIQSASDLRSELEHALQRANTAVYGRFEGRGGTTLTAVALTSDWCAAVHVGDSRLYRYAGAGDLEQVTVDDTVSGLLRAPSDEGSSNELLQFVGSGSSMLFQSYELAPPLAGQLLLTTDGVHSLGERFVQALLETGLVATLARAQCRGALSDNASVICIEPRKVVKHLRTLPKNAVDLICGGEHATVGQLGGN